MLNKEIKMNILKKIFHFLQDFGCDRAIKRLTRTGQFDIAKILKDN
tara:strand:+ start:471 stop:608 length:138 start_codon:yes stop_codon:yes gene_type:complete